MSHNNTFVSLHNHTEYSFLDGAIRIKDLVGKAKEFGMPAVAITDHGGLFGAVEFFHACKEAGIKPILGFEAYVAPGSRMDKTQAKEKDERYYSHLVLLAENNTGWKNLMQLSTIGYLEGFYYKPRIDMEVLRQYSEGIIATSACVAGAIPQALLRGDADGARKLTEEYISIFGKDNFYFELQDHGIAEEKAAMKGLIELGREMGVPFIVANDAHYLRREDAQSHEVLLCIGTKDTMDNPERYKFSSDQIYFKSPEEMAKLFPGIPEAMANTLEIAERCNVNIEVKPQMPSVDVPAEFAGPEEYLSHLAKEGLKEKIAGAGPEYGERLEFELKVINDMGYAGYFLIVSDFVREARDMGIMVGCRGSAAGSLVAYVIGITDVDPIRFGLIFERFLNPDRKSMPDADIDFADRDRYKVIDYVINKYGRDSVCQIINFGRMKAKAVVKDVARAMGISVAEANRLSSMIPKDDPKMTLKKAFAANKELVNAIGNSERYRELFRHAEALEGLVRQPGMHAAGVIIAPGRAADWAPLFKQSNADEIMTQFDMNNVEGVGLVKMDLLGLITLTVLQEALRLVKKYHGKDIDLWKLPADDQKTLEVFGRGETTGIFQFESPGMREYLSKLKPTSVEDVIAMNALYRPGPMDDIPTYIERKHKRKPVEYLHPILESIIGKTYGVITYQEDVMGIAQVMGGFTLAQADVLRWAMGKKKEKIMEEMGGKFIEGAAAQGVGKKTAKEIFDRMAKFAGYGFNKAHATVYAHLAYQTAYIKAHYPLEFITAYLAAHLEKQNEFLKMRNEANRLGIRMLPPSVNKSDCEFSIEDGAIRIGLGAVKNVGKAADIIIRAREEKGPFTSIFDICKSTDNRIVNKKALESLVCSGAFDEFEGTRAQHFEAVAMALEYGSASQKERDSGQVNLFDDMLASGGGAGSISAPEPALPKVAPWAMNYELQKEKEILGFYASGHPLGQFEDEVRGFSDTDIASEEFEEVSDGAQIMIGGLVTTLKQHVLQGGKQAGRQMGVLELETFDASIKVVAFTDQYEKFKELLVPDSMVLVRGILKREDSENKPELRLESCIPLSEARERLTRSVHVKVRSSGLSEEVLRNIHKCCSFSPGDCHLVIHVETAGNNRYSIKAGNISMSPNPEAIGKLRGMVGKENVWISRMAS